MSKAVINVILFTFLGLLLFVGLCSRYVEKNIEAEKLDTVFYLDTNFVYDTVKVYDTQIYKLNVNVPIYQIIDIDNDIVTYSDSLTDENISIYYTDTVQGRILGKGLNYKLHIPKTEIIKTVEVTKTQTIKKQTLTHDIFFQTQIGNYDKALGLIYKPKKGNFNFGYSYSFSTDSHNAIIQYKLCSFK